MRTLKLAENLPQAPYSLCIKLRAADGAILPPLADNIGTRVYATDADGEGQQDGLKHTRLRK